MLSRPKSAPSEPKEGDAASARLPFHAFAPAFAIFALALVVRLIGITWGLPNASRWYSYHPDESGQQIVGAVINLLQGDWNPHFFNYPSLAIYATYVLYMIQSVLGLSTPALGAEYPWNVTRDIIFAGRIFAVLCGSGTAVLAYLTAKELKPGRWAIMAGILAALTPGLVQHSHFATVDVPATFFVALCIWLTVRARDTRGLLWAAVAAGLATGTKYNGIIVLAAPLLALFLLPNQNIPRRIGIAPGMVVLSLLVFFITTPYALFSFREFWGEGENGFAFELLRHPRIGSGDIFINTGNGWWYHFSFNMPFAFTWPLLLAGIGGCVLVAKERKYWPLLAFAAIYFIAIGTSQVRFMRYTFLLAPVLCVTAAYLASWCALKFKAPGRLVGATTTGAILYGTAIALIPLTTPDNRDNAAAYLKDKPVALAGNPWFYTPPIQPQGFNQPVAGVEVTGFDLAKLKAKQPVWFVVSEYQVMESLRLNPNGTEAKFLADLMKISNFFENPVGTGLKNGEVVLHLNNNESPATKAYEPHDYLYTHPSIYVYKLPAAFNDDVPG